MAAKKTIIIHAGFHRCASTAIQRMLMTHRTQVEAKGIRLLICREDMRGRLSGWLFGQLCQYDQGKVISRIYLSLLRFVLLSIRANRVLVSEENLTGLMPGHLDTGFYPAFETFLKAVCALQKSFNIELRFCVRRQDEFLESAYAFRISKGATSKFDDFLVQIGPAEVSWLSLLKKVRQYDLGPVTRFLPIETWGPGAGLGKVCSFLELPDLTFADDMEWEANKRRDRSYLQAMFEKNGGETDHELKLTFSEKERKDLLTFYAQQNKEFLTDKMVDCKEDVWAY